MPVAGVEALLGTSAEGRLVATTDALDRFALIGADGTVRHAPSGRAGVRQLSPDVGRRAASDGAMWLSDGAGACGCATGG